jgi:YD repeat-containing protein
VYEDSRNFMALTGIVDENGVRFATWSYDSEGNAISSEHAGGVEKVTLAYQAGTTIATDAGGATRTYTSQIANGIALAGKIDETCGANCSRSRSMTYDANGNIATSKDGNGVVATYRYDLARDLETSRTEAFGTPVARTISTAWHATYRLPLKITEPKRITTYLYDGAGNLKTKTIQASNDASGAQGLTASGVGVVRTWTYAYNGGGQLLSINGPRIDVLDQTQYTYDPVTRDLSTMTNAAGQVTTLTNYDAHGHAGRIVAPNGITTVLSYTPRGWLNSKAVSANGVIQTTTYDYDNVGQLTKVTLPDTSVIRYTYDDAHRLTTISDSIGNSINYKLDNMSNRLLEEVKDPNGTLVRNTSRIFDGLNRVQQQTGGAQ